jgi:chromosome segregation ATPase
MIYTSEMIESEVSKISGTHIKRNNLRKKLKGESNLEVNNKIDEIKKQVRSLKAQGLYESDFRTLYAEISQLEQKIFW